MYNFFAGIDYTYYSAWEPPGGGRVPFRVQTAFIDAGWSAKTGAGVSRADVVQRFCERWSPNAFPIKGFGQLKARRGEKGDVDIPGAASFKRFRPAPIGTGGEYYIEISTAYYKDVLYGRLKIEPVVDGPQRSGYCEFPRDYPDDYFEQLTNTERLKEGAFRDTGPHEALDCRVYNLCASDFYLEARVKIMKEERKKAGLSPVAVEMTTNSRAVLEYIAAQIQAFTG
jgi:phage terminase large subunit GpA-like protein